MISIISLFWDERILMIINILPREVTFLIWNLRTEAVFMPTRAACKGNGIDQFALSKGREQCGYRISPVSFVTVLLACQ